jgi:hypothetical protein
VRGRDLEHECARVLLLDIHFLNSERFSDALYPGGVLSADGAYRSGVLRAADCKVDDVLLSFSSDVAIRSEAESLLSEEVTNFLFEIGLCARRTTINDTSSVAPTEFENFSMTHCVR